MNFHSFLPLRTSINVRFTPESGHGLVELLFFNERGKLNRAVVQDFDAGGGASNAHGADRRFDIHVAGMRHVARDERKRALGQTHQARIGMAMGIIDKVIQLHARIGGDAKRTAIREANAEVAVRAGLNDVASIDQIADLGLANASCGQIGLNRNRSRMIDPDCPRGREYLTNRICIGAQRQCSRPRPDSHRHQGPITGQFYTRS